MSTMKCRTQAKSFILPSELGRRVGHLGWGPLSSTWVCVWTGPEVGVQGELHEDDDGSGMGGVAWSHFLFLLRESIRRAEKGIKVYWLCYEHELAQLLAYIRVQTGDLEANVLFGLHDAKETFQLIANMYKSGDSTWKHGWGWATQDPYSLWHQ